MNAIKINLLISIASLAILVVSTPRLTFSQDAEIQDQDSAKNYRSEFTSFLGQNHPTASKETLELVRLVNSQMVRENIPMTRDHYLVAKSSILRGDGPIQYVAYENPHVVKSSGNGPVYALLVSFQRNSGFQISAFIIRLFDEFFNKSKF